MQDILIIECDEAAVAYNHAQHAFNDCRLPLPLGPISRNTPRLKRAVTLSSAISLANRLLTFDAMIIVEQVSFSVDCPSDSLV